MKYNKIPQFILTDVENGQWTGSFPAAALFVDISGFTQLTTQLMEHDIEGAEVLAQLINGVLGPLIETVYNWNGFITNLAGDAFIAVFPAHSAEGYQRALIAGWQISQHMLNSPVRTTRFGSFRFSIRVSIACGDVDWGTWYKGEGQEAEYYFIGKAIDHSLEIDQFVQKGTVYLSKELYEHLPHNLVDVDDSHQQQLRINGVDKSLLNALSSNITTINYHLARDVASLSPYWAANQPSGEFRQVATLFVNFQNLWAEQEIEKFQRTLSRLLAQYDGYLSLIGRVGPLDQGCTFVFFWGAPTNHENDLSRALNFVLNLRDASPVPIRAGITYNLVYAGHAGTNRYTKYTCFGNPVNLAARQFMAARWGEILLDEVTAGQVGTEFVISEHGWHHFKGIEDRQLIFTLNRRHVHAKPISFHNPIVGRQQELDRLWQAMQPILENKFGGIVTVVGEAGIGKSRLLYEIQQRIRLHFKTVFENAAHITADASQEIGWFQCQADEIRRQPLSSIKSFVYHYFEQSANQSAFVNKRNFVDKLDDLIRVTTDEELATELDRTRPLFAALIGLPWDDSRFRHLEPELWFTNTLNALKAFIKAESLRHPVVICIEDTHWIDKETQQFIDMLVRNVESYPFLLLLSTRPSTASAIEASASGTQIRKIIDANQSKIPRTKVALNRLGTDGLILLATYHLEGTVSPTLIDVLAEQSNGNPFYAEQLLLYWQEHQHLQWSDHGWQLQQHQSALFLPHASRLSVNARTILTARLDRLPAAVKEIVKKAAVLGREFDVRVLAHLCEQQEDLRSQLVKGEKFQIWSAQTATSYIFNHELLRNAAYDIQLRSHLRKLHRSATTAIEEVYAETLNAHYVDLVHHAHRGQDVEKERHYAQLAGKSAAIDYANEEALQFVNRALELTPEDEYERLFDLSLMREQTYDILGDRQQQQQNLEILEYLLPFIEDRERQAQYYLRSALYYRVTNHYNDALSALAQVKELASTLEDPGTILTYYVERGRVLIRAGDYTTAKAELNNGLMLAQKENLPHALVDNLSQLATIDYYESNYSIAQARFQKALAIYQSVGHPKGEINCLYMNSVISYKQGDYTEAQQQLGRALDISRAIGWRYSETFILGQLGNNYFDLGDYKQSKIYHQRARYLCQEINDLEGEAVSLDTLGLISLFLSSPQMAQLRLKQAQAIQNQIDDKHGLAFTLTHMGFTQIALGLLNAAQSAFEEAICLRQELGETAAMIDSSAGLAYVHWQQKDISTAVEQTLEIVEWIKSNGVDGIEFPVHVCQLCFKILINHSDVQAAKFVLETGYDIVRSRAAKIHDADIRRIFLHNVPFNREIVANWRRYSCTSPQERKALIHGH